MEAVLLSVQNMLSDPNENSPANIDAAVRASVIYNDNSWIETVEIRQESVPKTRSSDSRSIDS